MGDDMFDFMVDYGSQLVLVFGDGEDVGVYVYFVVGQGECVGFFVDEYGSFLLYVMVLRWQLCD